MKDMELNLLKEFESQRRGPGLLLASFHTFMWEDVGRSRATHPSSQRVRLSDPCSPSASPCCKPRLAEDGGPPERCGAYFFRDTVGLLSLFL